MFVEPDRRPSGETPDTVTSSEPTTTKRTRKSPEGGSQAKHYLAPTDKLDFLLAKDIDPKLTPIARRVLSLIMAHRNKHTGEAFPSEATMARILKVKRVESISEAIRLLVKLGWITKARKRRANSDGDIYGCNHYTPLMDRVTTILAEAGISFTNGLAKEDDQLTVSRVGNIRFSGSETPEKPGKPHDNQPSEPVKVNPSKKEQEQNEAETVVSPPVLSSDERVSGRKRSGWDKPDFDDEYYEFIIQFPGNTMEDRYQGCFAGIRQRGFTLADTLVALEYDTKISNPHGKPRTIASFFHNYFAEGATKEDVESWRKALPGSKSKPVTVTAPAEPRPSTTSDAPKANSYGLTPSQRRAKELAYGTGNRGPIEVPF